MCGSAHVTSPEQADLLRQEGEWELPPAGGGGVDDAGVYTLALQSDDSVLDVDRVTV